VSEAAHELGVHENTIRNWVEKGILKAVRLPSGHRRLDPAEVDNLRLGILGNLAPATVGPRVELGDDLELDFQYGDPDS
jgi:excisionase family DNA binding protein